MKRHQLNVRVDPTLKDKVHIVHERTHIPIESIVEDALHFFLGDQEPSKTKLELIREALREKKQNGSRVRRADEKIAA